MTCFNSNMVRLKGVVSENPRPMYRSFNSNMVRLKVNKSKLCVEPKSWFQFQYGSIKRRGEGG